MSSKRKSTGDSSQKKQITLSKFFSTSQGKKSTQWKITDEANTFQVQKDEPVKKKTKTSSGGPSALSQSNDSGKQAAQSGPSVNTSQAVEKLSKFSLIESNEMEHKGCDIRQSKNVLQLSLDDLREDISKAVDSEDDQEQSNLDPVMNPTLLKLSKSTQDRQMLFKNTNMKSKSMVKVKYTPLEQQFVDIKAKNPDAVLFVECGYKYRFFGEDAEIAANVLKIYCHLDHNFMTASIPVHRLFVHVRRLVSAGYKVGVVKQTETAHLKAAGENKSGPFTRKLSALYTKATLIGEDLDPLTLCDEGPSLSSVNTNSYLMCICEGPRGPDGKTRTVGVMCVDPSTGDVVHDSLQDSATFEELETVISYFSPVEVLLSSTASDDLEKIVTDIAALSSTEDDRIRVEKLHNDEFEHPQAFTTVSDFFKNKDGAQNILALDKPVLSCLAALISYLKEFSLEKTLLQTSSFTQFSPRSQYMRLSGNSLRNLEIFANASDGRERGSLFWMLNHTLTKFGARTLRKWLIQPLLNVKKIISRQNAVEEIRDRKLERLKKVTDFMSKMPDVEKLLYTAYHRKCSVLEFHVLVKTMSSVLKVMQDFSQNNISMLKSSMLCEMFSQVPDLLESVTKFTSVIDEKAAREKDKANLFKDCSRFPVVMKRKMEIEEAIQSIDDHRRDVRLILKQPGLIYITVLQVEFLIEVKNSMLSSVPSDWTQISSTKQVSRYHTPFIVKQYNVLNSLREQLILDINDAWLEVLQEFSSDFTRYKKAIHYLAELDCLMSLAKTASLDSFCKPSITNEQCCVEIEGGRHPIIDALRSEQDQYVPNDTALKADGTRVMVISGPNMGGKSSYIRQVALLTMLAQIGSYVPAKSMNMGIVDAIYTRMGATDDLFKGQSAGSS